MFNFVIIAGLNDKDTKRQEIDTETARATVAGIVCKYADGATLTDCNGIYKHQDGSGAVVFEKSIKIEICGITKENAERIADELKTALNQESVYFSMFAADVRFI